jgi:hypothetical protein
MFAMDIFSASESKFYELILKVWVSAVAQPTEVVGEGGFRLALNPLRLSVRVGFG